MRKKTNSAKGVPAVAVQRSVVLRITITEATQLKEILNAFRRDYDDNDCNRTARMLAYDLGNKLTAAVEKEKQHNAKLRDAGESGVEQH